MGAAWLTEHGPSVLTGSADRGWALDAGLAGGVADEPSGRSPDSAFGAAASLASGWGEIGFRSSRRTGVAFARSGRTGVTVIRSGGREPLSFRFLDRSRVRAIGSGRSRGRSTGARKPLSSESLGGSRVRSAGSDRSRFRPVRGAGVAPVCVRDGSRVRPAGSDGSRFRPVRGAGVASARVSERDSHSFFGSDRSRCRPARAELSRSRPVGLFPLCYGGGRRCAGFCQFGNLLVTTGGYLVFTGAPCPGRSFVVTVPSVHRMCRRCTRFCTRR
jgi:hypothetical protein